MRAAASALRSRSCCTSAARTSASPRAAATRSAWTAPSRGFIRALDHELREQGIRCTNICPGGVATDFALDEGRGRTADVLAGMMSAEDVAEVVVFALERPRRFRMLDVAFRPMTEPSWG